MPDFDVNESLTEAGSSRAKSPADSSDAAEEQPPAAAGFGTPPPRHPRTPPAPRVREGGRGHRAAAGPRRRVGVRLIARRRMLARRCCAPGTPLVLARGLRSRRRLWTTCHGSR